MGARILRAQCDLHPDGPLSNFFRLAEARMALLQPFFLANHGKHRVDNNRVLIGTNQQLPSGRNRAAKVA